MFMFNQMERVLGITIFLACLFLAQSVEIDITKEGAKDGGEIGPTLLKVWGTACNATTPTKIVIPDSSFSLEEIVLQGPCQAPIELQVDAIVKGPDNPSVITKDNEWIMIENVEHFTLSGKGTFDGRGGSKAWVQSDRCSSQASCSKMANSLAFFYVNHSTVTGITSKDSKLFHFNLLGCENFTIQGVSITAPASSPNTDGIHIGRSKGVKVVDCQIKTGDDCISLGDGCKDINVTGVTCGPGHGISVGSLGKYENEEPLEGIHFSNCNLTNTDNGVRIKTWAASLPLTAADIHFENIHMDNVSNPIVIDQEYCPNPPCKLDPPSKVAISKVSIKGLTGTFASPLVAKIICSKSNPCKDVEIGDINLVYKGPEGPVSSNCSNVEPTFVGNQTPKLCGPAGAAAPTAGAPAPNAKAPKAEDPKGKAKS